MAYQSEANEACKPSDATFTTSFKYIRRQFSSTGPPTPGEDRFFNRAAYVALLALTLSLILYATLLVLIESNLLTRKRLCGWRKSQVRRLHGVPPHSWSFTRPACRPSTRRGGMRCKVSTRTCLKYCGFSEEELAGDAEDGDVREERRAMEATSDAQLAISCRGLYKFYGPRMCAVRNLTFGVRGGEIFGLLGRRGWQRARSTPLVVCTSCPLAGVNGAGKTTTFDIFAGIQTSTAGNASIGNTPVEQNPYIGYCKSNRATL